MKKNRMVAGVVLTAGLGLTGVVTASSSGAATPGSAHSAKSAQAQAQVVGAKAKGHGGAVFCVVEKGGKPGQPLPLPGKPGPGKPLPAKPLPGKPLPGEPSTVAKAPGKVVIKVVNGKVYVNGKLVKGRIDTKCPLPPLPFPGKPGKGGVFCIQDFATAPGHAKPGGKDAKTTVKVVGGKVYVNGKLLPKGKVNKDCPVLPPFPGPGKGGGVIVKPGQGAGSVTFPAPGGGSVTWSEGGSSAKGGSDATTTEAGLTTSGLRG